MSASLMVIAAGFENVVVVVPHGGVAVASGVSVGAGVGVSVGPGVGVAPVMRMGSLA
jgi:hypothetical protein